MRRWSCASGKSVRGANLVLHGQSASAGLLWPAWPVADRHVTRFLWLCIRRGSRRSVCLFVRMSSRLAMLLIRMRPPPLRARAAMSLRWIYPASVPVYFFHPPSCLRLLYECNPFGAACRFSPTHSRFPFTATASMPFLAPFPQSSNDAEQSRTRIFVSQVRGKVTWAHPRLGGAATAC